MKLLSIKINNFGKLSNYKLDIENNLTKIIENNGWGKSTLSDFICVMFYGFKDEGKKAKEEREREKYRPWQGGDYGGSIKFEVNGITYLITKIFGSKESEDKYVLKNVTKNISSNEFGPSLGEQLFDLDRESFEKTIYIDRNGCHTAMTSKISAKLGNVMDNNDDINNFDDADSLLKDLLSSMNPNSKKGSINKLENEIYNLSINAEKKDELLENLESESKEKEQKEKELGELTNRLKELQKEQNELSAFKDLQTKKSKYDDITRNVSNREKILKENRLLFPKDIPTQESVNDALEKSFILNKKKSEQNAYFISDENMKIFDQLNSLFSKNRTSLDEMEKMKSTVKEYIKSEYDIDKYKLTSGEEMFINENSVFDINPVDPELIKLLKDKWIIRNQKTSLLDYKKKNPLNNESNSQLILAILLLFFSLAIVICSMLLRESLSSYFIYIIVFACALGLFSFIILLKSKKTKKEKINKTQNEIKADEESIRTTDEEVKTFLKRYHVDFDENSVSSNFDLIISRFNKYNEIKSKQAKYSELENDFEKKSLKNNIEEYMSKFIFLDDNTDFDKEIDKLINEFKEFESLQSKIEMYDRLEKECNVIKAELDDYLNDIGFGSVSSYETKIKKINDDLKDYLFSLNEYNISVEKMKEFIENNDVKSFENIKITNDKSSEKLNAEINRITEEIDTYKEEISDINDYLDGIRESYDNAVSDENSLLEKQQILKEQKEKYELIKITRKILSEAKSSFINRYVGPISKSFDKYYEMATQETSDIFSFDANANLTYEEHGLPRVEESLSSGYQDVVGLCTRAALIDAMYQKEKPIIIMDDPFTNLDNDKVKGALKLLDKLSQNYQILYFTCHDSRK